MEQSQKEQTLRSVFRDGGNTVSKRRFTEKWIELIAIREADAGNTPDDGGRR